MPKRIRYNDKSKERSGEIDYIGLNEPIPKNADLAYTSTFHVCQGLTVGKIWLCDDRVTGWCPGAIYVGITRVERMAQLGLLEIPVYREDKNAVKGTFEEILSRKIKNYRTNDLKHKREFSLTLEALQLEALKLTNGLKTCHLCQRKLEWSNYSAGSPFQFSVDRIDNSIGHTYNNCQITCLGCNVWRCAENKHEMTNLD